MVVQQLVEKFVDYVAQDETRMTLEQKFIRPVVEYLGERFSWTLKAFQALAVLVGIQTLLLLWLLLRTYRVPVQ